MNEPVLVIIVNFGLAHLVERLLASGAVSGQRVLLVDNNSQPDELAQISRLHGTELLLLDRNAGFAGAVNRGIAHVDGHGPVLLLNPDVILDAADLAALRTALDLRGVTGVTPLLVNLDGSLQVGTAGGPLTLSGFILYFGFLSHMIPAALGIFHTRRQLALEVPPRWACMACLLLDAEAFSRYGPIPEDELVYGEDVAWGCAASRDGASFSVAASVPVVHEQGAAGASLHWRGALARLALRELGPLRGRLAVAVMGAGLAIRRIMGRCVDGRRVA